MPAAPLLPSEPDRLAALRALQVLDTPAEASFDSITEAVRLALDVPVVLVSLVDAERQWFKSCIGLDCHEMPRDQAFCAHVINQDDILIVEDARNDDRFTDNPLVEQPGIRFYAGVPLKTASGHNIGTLCAIDFKPRGINTRQQEMMVELANAVVHLMEVRTAGTQLVSAQAELVEQQEHMNLLAMVAARTDNAVIITDGDGRIEWINEGFTRLTGYTFDEVKGAKPGSLLHGPDTNQETVVYARNRLRRGLGFEIEIINYHKSGTSYWVSLEVQPMRNSDGEITHFMSIERDITEQKLYENELAITRERFKLLSKATADVVWDLNVHTGHVWWNDNLRTAFGYKPGSVEPTLAGWSQLIHPDDCERVAGSFDKAIASGQSHWEQEYRFKRADGSYACVLDRAFLIQDENDRTIRGVGAIVDLTEQKNAAAEIEFRKTLLECQSEASLDGILIVDNDRRVISYNRRFVEMWGLNDHPIASANDKLLVQNVLDKLVDPENFLRRAEELYNNPDCCANDEIELIDGRTFDRHTSTIRSKDGVLFGRVWYFRDVTESKQYARQLEQHKLVVENSNAVLFRWRAEDGWPVELVSDNVVQFGYTAEELLSGHVNFATMVYPDDLQRTAEEVQHYSQSGADSFEQEYRLICRDGTVRWIYDRTVVERDESGTITHFQGIVIDITERKDQEQRMQLLLLEREERVKETQVLVSILNIMHEANLDVDVALQWVADLLPEAFQVPQMTVATVRFGDRVFKSANIESTEHSISSAFQCEDGTRGVVEVFVQNEVLSADDKKIFLDEEHTLVHTVAELLASHLDRVRIQEELRKQKIVVDNSNTVLFRWRVDEDWPVELVSDNVRQFGYEPYELLSGQQLFADIVHPDDRDRIESEVLECCRQGQGQFEQEYRIVCRDGNVRWVYDRTTTECNSEGVITHIQGLVIDITERKAAEAALRQSEDRLRNIAAQVPGAVYQFVLYPDGTRAIPYISDGVQQLCGLSAKEIVSGARSITETIVPADTESFEQSIVESARTMLPWHAEFRILHTDGSIRWIGGESVPQQQADGSILWHGIITDITERKNAEAKLHRLTAIIEATTDFVGMADSLGRAVYINPAGRRMIGLDEHETLNGTHVTEYSSSEAAKLLEYEALPHAAEHGWWSGDTQLEHQDGTIVPVSQVILAHKNPRGEVDYFSTVMRDMTEQKRTEQKLKDAMESAEAANRAKSEFLANMSHEIRTPLTAILGYAELLRNDEAIASSPSKRSEMIDTILRAGEHLVTIINDILDISKIEAGRMTIQSSEVFLPHLLEEVTSLMQGRADASGLDVNLQFATPLPERVVTDATRLRQILMNIIGNAVKFTEQGSVDVTVEMDQNATPARLHVQVTDTGPGMDEAQQQSLFTPFSQCDASLTRKHGGTGLGLSIARRCANLLGGDVTLVRSTPGEGSCFAIELPVKVVADAPLIHAANQIAASTPAPARAEIKLNGRILLAEDGVENQKLIAFHLRKAGAHVDVADNGQIALAMIRNAAHDQQPYDMLVTDIQMPEMDGYALAQQLRSDGFTIPIVALTAHAMAEDRTRCLEAGCNDYASKPINKARLLDVCHRWLSETRTPADHESNA